MKKWLVTPTEKDQIMETLTYSLDEKTIIITNSWGGGWFIFESENKPYIAEMFLFVLADRQLNYIDKDILNFVSLKFN